ncbi:response regulator [Paenibacillus xerothermodurans]|uniref:DNA-binding response regulator n=1 Tax=Paenibacillus xerothermodurans TaxID=1977292 RepID=A0A2W1NUZ1_PAEXE|nr:response regulator [Paenibacillus xerothermodurans]PZE19502.1 DNA-binding response regulator [Paenibacillus xerothermodurans]
MFKVLLVDDERIILDGISNGVDWEAAGTVLAGTARNGIEALSKVTQEPPDIIISDIRMPGMDGLQLAERISQSYPDIKLVLLSGFGEFEHARSAMQYGVKQYLLKPCNENKIIEVLHELVAELEQNAQREQFVRQMRDGLDKVLPHAKEQFLREFVTNKTYGDQDWEYYRTLFGLNLDNPQVRLILFQLEGAFEFEHMFAVKNIAEDLLDNTVLSCTVGRQVLIVVEDTMEPAGLLERITQIRQTFLQYYKIGLTAAISEADHMTRARVLYQQNLECLNHRFYLGEGSLITQRDIVEVDKPASNELIFDEDHLMLQIKTGCWEEASDQIDLFFQKVAALRLDIPTARSYVIQLFMAIIRLGDSDAIDRDLDKLITLSSLDTLQTIQTFFKETAHHIALQHYEKTKNKHCIIVHRVLDVINEHLGNPELSLSWVANQMLYMNCDYLGKLFKKETGEKFSNYVMKARMARATELIEQKSDIKIFELAEQTGFGDNPQYFSQVFKKYTGRPPSEYMKTN